MSDWLDGQAADHYAYGAFEEREAAADWRENVRHWTIEHEDRRNRDAGEDTRLPKLGVRTESHASA